MLLIILFLFFFNQQIIAVLATAGCVKKCLPKVSFILHYIFCPIYKQYKYYLSIQFIIETVYVLSSNLLTAVA